MVDYLIAAAILLVLVLIGWSLIKSIIHKAALLIINGVAGVLILLILDLYLGWHIPLNSITIGICAVFGIPGVATLIILNLFGMMN